MHNDIYERYRAPQEIERLSFSLREILGVRDQYLLDLIPLIENKLSSIVEAFSLCVEQKDQLGDTEAYTSFNPPCIVLREDVYTKSASGDARGRFTLAHELGHLVLHGGEDRPRKEIDRQRLSFAVRSRSSEAQASMFAGAFLLPSHIVREIGDPVLLSECCGVTLKVAEIRMRDLGLWPKKSERIREGFAELLNALNGSNSK